MIRFIKRWWLLKNLRKATLLHTSFNSVENLAMGKKVLLAQHFLIVGAEKYPGLAYKSLHRFSWILWYRRKDNPEKLKRRIQEYNDILEVCRKEGYIEIKQTEKGPMLSADTSLADKISGPSGLLQELLSRYHLAWTLIIIPLILGILGSSIFKRIWERIISLGK